MTSRICHYPDLENAVDGPERAGQVAALLDRLRDRGPALVVDGGDVLGPSLLGTETDGAHVPRTHAALGTDVATVGNHDLDYGAEALHSVVRESPATVLSADLHVDGESLSDEPGVRRWTMRDVGDQNVALTGVIARELVENHWIADETSLRATAAEAAVERALADAVPQRASSTTPSSSPTADTVTTGSPGSARSTSYSAATSTTVIASGWRTRSWRDREPAAVTCWR